MAFIYIQDNNNTECKNNFQHLYSPLKVFTPYDSNGCRTCLEGEYFASTFHLDFESLTQNTGPGAIKVDELTFDLSFAFTQGIYSAKVRL